MAMVFAFCFCLFHHSTPIQPQQKIFIQILFQNIRASIDDQITDEYGEYTRERHPIGTGPCSVGSDQRLPIVIVIDTIPLKKGQIQGF